MFNAENIVVLGAGKSGIGAAILAQKKGKNVFDPSVKFIAEYRQDISGQKDNNSTNVNLTFSKKVNFSCKFLWFRNPKCFDENGDLKSNTLGNNPTIQHGLVYNLKTDKFEPFNQLSN